MLRPRHRSVEMAPAGQSESRDMSGKCLMLLGHWIFEFGNCLLFVNSELLTCRKFKCNMRSFEYHFQRGLREAKCFCVHDFAKIF